MGGWELLEKSKFDPFTKKAKPEEMHLYTKEVEEEMIADVRKQARELFEDWQGSHSELLWPQLQERCQELAEKRISQIEMFFSMKRTGSPLPSLEELRAMKGRSAG